MWQFDNIERSWQLSEQTRNILEMNNAACHRFDTGGLNQTSSNALLHSMRKYTSEYLAHSRPSNHQSYSDFPLKSSNESVPTHSCMRERERCWFSHGWTIDSIRCANRHQHICIGSNLGAWRVFIFVHTPFCKSFFNRELVAHPNWNR